MPKNISNMAQIEGSIFTQSLTREDYVRSMNEIPARLQQQQQQQSQMLHNPNYMQQQQQQQPAQQQQHQQQQQQLPSMSKPTIIVKQPQQPIMSTHQMQQGINLASGGPKQVRLIHSVRPPQQQQQQQFQQQ
jgi:nitrate/TMAO reductase-like tetraheme cytochrome c subunit